MLTRKRCDVAVIGGGTAGAVAAIAAARSGAQTVLVEQYGSLGGMAGTGMPFLGTLDGNGKPALGGIGEELFARLREMGAATEHYLNPRYGSHAGADPEMLRFLLMAMYAEANGGLLMHSFLVDSVVEPGNPGRLKGVIVANKGGLQFLPTSIVVDATGDADVAFRAGAFMEKGRESDHQMQPVTAIFRVSNVDLQRTFAHIEEHPEDVLVPPPGHASDPFTLDYLKRTPGINLGGWSRFIQAARSAGEWDIPRSHISFSTLPDRGEVSVNATRIQGVDATDPDQLSWAEQEAHRQMAMTVRFLRKYIPGFENCRVMSVPFQLGVRETRRILGPYVLTTEDVLQGRDFADGIGRGAYPLDVHDVKPGHVMGRQADGTTMTLFRIMRSYSIPYRCLYPKNVDNLLVAGRSISATHEAAGSTRGLAVCMVTGHAAGTAAAMSATLGVVPRELPVGYLQQALLDQGAVLELEESQ